MADTYTSVTTSISGAKFSDGSTMSGTWTAVYDVTTGGTLSSITSASFSVTGSGGTTTFTSMGTLPYAVSPSGSSFEIHSLSQTGGTYSALYVDWKTETPSSLYEGTPSLYTSVRNGSGTSPTTPLRLISDGTTGSGSIPVISGLPSAESGTDAASLSPFSSIGVTDPDSSTTVSATITLTNNGTPTDLDGLLSGTGLTKTGGQSGTYTLSATTPATLQAELQALKFTPTAAQVAVGNTVSTLFALAVNDSDGSTSSSTTLTITATCFLRGTMIATPQGEQPVEALRAGELVSVLENGVRTARTITWAGSGRMDAASFGGRDEAFPIRIRRDAFAENLPHRDLLITPEHRVFVEGGLIPARMLVNGRSICVERSLHQYEFFHVELERHGILVSEGLATESYFDSGNRNLFGDALGIPARAAASPPAAPLVVDRASVEPLWRRLANRARDIGMEHEHKPKALTETPELRLLLDDGRELPARWHNSCRYMFHVPSGARPTRLLSRAAVPAEIIGPFVDDRRMLGVAVEKLILWNGLDNLALGTDAQARDGWYAAEGAYRWTNGSAQLDLPSAGSETFVDVHLAATLLYEERVSAR